MSENEEYKLVMGNKSTFHLSDDKRLLVFETEMEKFLFIAFSFSNSDQFRS